jgi:hypothetical protein
LISIADKTNIFTRASVNKELPTQYINGVDKKNIAEIEAQFLSANANTVS